MGKPMEAHSSVTIILKYITDYCECLYAKHGFWFEQPEPPADGGHASIILARPEMAISFTCEKWEFLIEISCLLISKKNDWYGLDLVRNFVEGNYDGVCFMTSSNAQFLCNHMVEILGLFADHQIAQESWAKINKMAVARSRKMFRQKK